MPSRSNKRSKKASNIAADLGAAEDEFHSSPAAFLEEPDNREPRVRNEPADDDDHLEGDEATVMQSRMLAIHVVPDRPGDVQIGAAFIDVADGRINYLGRTIGWEGDFQFITELLFQLAEPISTILVSAKTKEGYLESLRAISSERKAPSDDSPFGDLRSTKIVLLPGGYFDYQSACRLIATKMSAHAAVGSVIDVSNYASVQATGALLTHIQRIFPDLPPIEFDMFDLESFLIIDAGSARALDITRIEEHPSVIRGRGKPKEGFSLVSLLDRARSKQGSRLLRRWVARPLTDIVEINQRLDAVEYLIQHLGMDTLARIMEHLSKIGDVHKALLRLKTCNAQAKDWLTLADSLSHCQAVLTELSNTDNVLIGSMPSYIDLIRRVGQSASLTQVMSALDTLDWEQARSVLTTSPGRVVPLDGVVPMIDECRMKVSQLPYLLEEETRQLNIQGVSMRCIPVIGFVIACDDGVNLPAELAAQLLFEAQHQDQEKGILRFYKISRTRLLDAQLGDIPGTLRDFEDQYLRKIEGVILAYEADLLLIGHRCAELDALLSLAEVAHDFDYCRPDVRKEPISDFVQARHPLLERVLDKGFVPSDIRIDAGCTILTGPNYSGKSVVLKTVALIHVMAQVGSFVPAKTAMIGVIDRIFTRITSLQSIAGARIQRESSFSLDIQQIVSVLRCCTPNSLILVDEFGKGTNSLDGSALLAAVIEHLSLEKCGPTPRSIFATHLVEVFDAGLLKPEHCILAEMMVDFEEDQDSNTTEDQNKLMAAANRHPVPLFRVRVSDRGCGQPDQHESFGIACAKRAGVPETILSRAIEIVIRLRAGGTPWRLDERAYQTKKRQVHSVVRHFLQLSLNGWDVQQHKDGEATSIKARVDTLYEILQTLK